MAGRQFRRSVERLRVVAHPVVLLETGLEPVQDGYRLFDARLGDVDLLESPRERVVFLEDTAVFLVRRRTDTANLTVCQHRLDQVAGIHDTARRGTGTDDGMDLVDEQNRARVLLYFLDDALEALLEVTAVLGARNQRAHVQSIDRRIAENFRHSLLGDHARKAFRKRRLADTRVSHIERVVLPAPAQYLHRPFNFDLTADQRVDLAVDRELVEVGRVALERRSLRLRFRLQRRLLLLAASFARELRHPVGDVVDDVQPRNVLQIQEIHGL